MGVKFYEKSAGYAHPGFCTSCKKEGILYRKIYSNGIAHAHLFCPECGEKLSGSIARDELRKHEIDINSLPLAPEPKPYEAAPRCETCHTHPKLGKHKIRGEFVPVWFCAYCEEIISNATLQQVTNWHKTIDDLDDVGVIVLRAMDYEEYLQTDWWRRISYSMKWIAGFKCQLCAKTDNLQVHHNNYKRRGCERPEDLIVLCRGCHMDFHKIEE